MASLTSGPHAKRPRLDVGDTCEIVYHKDETLWLPDGNIVLAAREDLFSTESTTNTRLFKCHKGVLSRHSVVFRDLFENACPCPTEQHDDTPLMTLWDSATDVKNLLTWLYDPTKSPYERNRRETFAMRLSILRLATKYQMDDIRNHVVSLLELDWPNTLEQWDSNEVMLQHQWVDLDVHKMWNKDQKVDIIAPEPASVIRLAYELDVPNLLHAAFYHATRCCRGDPRIAEENYQMTLDPFERSLASGLLTQDEMFRLVLAKDWLHKTTFTLVHYLIPRKIDEAIDNCSYFGDDTKECVEPLKVWWIEQTKNGYAYGGIFDDPLATLNETRKSLLKLDEGCYYCRHNILEAIAKAREFLWSGIPFWSSSAEQRNSQTLPALPDF